jgi:membrane protease YdiL (CAAX protease family)
MEEIASNKNKTGYLFLEILLLFVFTPIVLNLSILLILKISYLVIGILYIFWVAIKNESFRRIKITSQTLKNTLLSLGFRFVIIALGTISFLYFDDKQQLFNVVLNKPILWLKFSGVYILFSVIPQELIYRTFFVKRYRSLLKNKTVFILLNSALFSFAHIWFQSWIVLFFTFIGSLFFINSYLKTKSIGLVILEHSLYGVWLYTVGYGELFMFPV